MKHFCLFVCLVFLYNCTYAQVGTWQLSIKRTDIKETGIAYVTCDQDGTLSGYGLTTLSFGIATYSGTWTTDGQGELFSNFTEELNGQHFTGALQAKFKATSVKGTAIANGVTYKFKGKPAISVPNLTGNWNGTITQSGLTVAETFTATENPDFPGIFDFSGIIFSSHGERNAFGQVAIDPSGKAVGYSDTEIDAFNDVLAYFTGKYNPGTDTVTVKGIDSNGVKLIGKFHR